jgi:hypothetical protein
MCLSAGQRRQLAKFLHDGGTIIATGPIGYYDERANPVAKPWLEDFDLPVELEQPARPGGFPPYKNFKEPVSLAQCQVMESLRKRMPEGWFDATAGSGKLLWRPGRMTQKDVADAVIKILHARDRVTMRIDGLPADWRLRQYRDGNRLLIHALPGQVETVLHPTLRNHLSNECIIEKLNFTPLTRDLILESPVTLTGVVLHSPDLTESRAGAATADRKWSMDPTKVSRYFILECFA